MAKYKYEVILGALLHDIGKFYQKGLKSGEDIDGVKAVSGGHSLISAEFVKRYRDKFEALNPSVDVNAILEIVQRHHTSDYGKDVPEMLVKNANPKYKHLCALVSTADNISSSERYDQDTGDGGYQTKPLAHIFSLKAEKSYKYKVGDFSTNYEASTIHKSNNVAEIERLNGELTAKSSALTTLSPIL